MNFTDIYRSAPYAHAFKRPLKLALAKTINHPADRFFVAELTHRVFV